MKLARRVLVTVLCTLAAIALGVRFIAPTVLSFFVAREAPAVARVVPTDLRDRSVSDAAGARLSYFGYEFEVPWDDLDKSKTLLYPKDKPAKTSAVLVFQSGLHLMVGAIPPREMADAFTNGTLGFGKIPPQGVDLLFGSGSATSDYIFVNNVYNFTPDRMHYWSLSNSLHAREMILLTIKSIMPSPAAESGIFRVQNRDYKGFQQGNPAKHPHRVSLTLYSDDGGVEFVFSDRDSRNPARVTQPEINRIVGSLHRAAPSDTTTAAR
jgi:hypothetical protein